jgi:hypothetical protein
MNSLYEWIKKLACSGSSHIYGDPWHINRHFFPAEG